MIIGFYGEGNAGDEAILSCLIRQIRREPFGSNITVVSRSVSHTKREHAPDSVIPSFPKNPLSFLSELMKSDELILGGGGHFCPRVPVAFTLAILLAHLSQIKVAFIGISVGPISYRIDRMIFRRLLSLVSYVSVRDDRSYRWLTQQGFEAHRGVDLAFEQKYHNIKSGDEYVAVSLRPIEWNPLDTQQYATFFDRFIEQTGSDLLFVPLNHPRDSLTSKRVADAMSHEVTVVDRDLSFTAVDELFADAELVIGMRLHSLILAARNRTKTLGIIYHFKCEEILKELGDHYYMWYDEVDAEAADEAAARLNDEYHALRTRFHALRLETHAATSYHSYVESGIIKSFSVRAFVEAVALVPLSAAVLVYDLIRRHN